MLGLFKHRRVAGLLSSYIDGQVSRAERRVVEDHLAACDACSRELDELRRTVSLIGGLPELRPGRSYALSSAHQEDPARRPAFSLWAPGIAAAACAVLLVVVISGQAAGVLVQSGGFGEESESYADAPAVASAPQIMALDEAEAVEEDAALAGMVVSEAASAGTEETTEPEEQEIMEAAMLESEVEVEEEAAFDEFAEMQEAEESELMEAAMLESEVEVEAVAMEAMSLAEDESALAPETQADFDEVDDADLQALSESEDAPENLEDAQGIADTLDRAAVETPAEPGSEGIALPLWQIQLAAGIAFAVFAMAGLVAGLVRRMRR